MSLQACKNRKFNFQAFTTMMADGNRFSFILADCKKILQVLKTQNQRHSCYMVSDFRISRAIFQNFNGKLFFTFIVKPSPEFSTANQRVAAYFSRNNNDDKTKTRVDKKSRSDPALTKELKNQHEVHAISQSRSRE